MKKSKFTESQIIGYLRRMEQGEKTSDLCRDELVPFVKQLLCQLKLMLVFKQPRNRPGKVFCLEEKNDLCVDCNSQ